ARVVEPPNEVAVVLTTESVEPDDGAVPVEAAVRIPDEYAAPLTVEEAAVMAAETSAESAPAAEQTDTLPTASVDDEKRGSRQRDRKAPGALRCITGELIADYSEGGRGMEVREMAGGYRVTPKPKYHDAVRGFGKSLKPPMKLSLQALETLAVIAYKQ